MSKETKQTREREIINNLISTLSMWNEWDALAMLDRIMTTAEIRKYWPELGLVEEPYEVWALGEDKDYGMTDDAILLKAFSNRREAIEFAKSIESIPHSRIKDSRTVRCNIEVETVVENDDGKGTTNIDTIYEDCVNVLG